MHDLMSIEEDKLAAALGFGLYHVFELEQSKWAIRVLPAEASQHVINLARTGNPLAVKALRILMHGPEGKK